MDCSLPGSFVYGIFQARILEWAAISFSSVHGSQGWKTKNQSYGCGCEEILLILCVKHSFIYTDSTETDIQISVDGQLGKLAKKYQGQGPGKTIRRQRNGLVVYSLSSFSMGIDWPCFTK